MAPRVAFLGTPEVAVPALGALAQAWSIEAVFTNPDRPAGRGRNLVAPPVKVAALERGLQVYQPRTWKDPDIRSLWENLRLDLAVVVAYGHLLPSWLLDSLPLGAWNLHFSLLPRWRGAAPVNHAILAGDEETGVSLMRLTPGLDEGPVLAMTRRPICLADDAPGLLSRLAEDAAGLLAAHLPALGAGTAKPSVQEGPPTFAPKLSKDMARPDLKDSATAFHRRVRALEPWPGTELPFQGGTLKVRAVGALRPSQDPPGLLRWDKAGAWLTCGEGQAVELRLLQREGKPIQPALQALQPLGPLGTISVV